MIVEQQATSLMSMAVHELSERCAQRSADGQSEHYCIELFRRAILTRDAASWDAIYAQYIGLVQSWLTQHPLHARLSKEDREEVVLCPFIQFWRYFGEDRLANAKGLGYLLAYLRDCVSTCLIDRIRKQKRGELLPVEDEALERLEHGRSTVSSAEIVGQRLRQAQIWKLVAAECKDERESAIARLVLTTNMKPGDIFESHPELFPDVNTVHAVKRNLFARLGRNPALKTLWAEEAT